MHDMTRPVARRARGTIATVLRAGTVVALTDGLWAVLLWVVMLRKTTAARVFQGIARAVLGDAAFAGGGATVALGVALHFAVAMTWAFVYALLLRRSAVARRTVSAWGPAVTALAIGTVVWTTMDLLVLPLTRTRATPLASAMFAVNLAGHVLFVGLPLALLVRER